MSEYKHFHQFGIGCCAHPDCVKATSPKPEDIMREALLSIKETIDNPPPTMRMSKIITEVRNIAEKALNDATS